MSPKLPRTNFRVLTGFLIGALPVLAVGVILVLGIGQARLRDSYSRHLAEVAEQTTATVDRYVFRRIVDASILARTPTSSGWRLAKVSGLSTQRRCERSTNSGRATG